MSVPASVQDNWWSGMAAKWFNQAVALASDPTNPSTLKPATWATLARVCGEINGWADPRIPGWYAQCVALRLPGGGYGQNLAYDGNPVDTSYGIILGDFVGPHLAEGRNHGVVSQADFESAMAAAAAFPCTTNTRPAAQGGNMLLPDYATYADGSVMSHYHGQNNIWNITAALGAFLLGHRNDIDQSTPSGVALFTLASSRGTDWVNACKWGLNKPSNFGGWPYQCNLQTVRQDSAHNAVLSDLLQPWVGDGPALTQLAAGPYGSESWGSYLGGIRLLKNPACGAYINGVMAGRVSDNPPTGTDAGGFAAAALNCILAHKTGLTL